VPEQDSITEAHELAVRGHIAARAFASATQEDVDRITAAMLLALATITPSTLDAQGTGRIRGKVIDADDKAALAEMTPKGREPGEAAAALKSVLETRIDPLLDWSSAALESALRAEADALSWPAKDLFLSVRVAATGRAASPPLFETLGVLGKEVVRRRLRRAIEALRGAKTGS